MPVFHRRLCLLLSDSKLHIAFIKSQILKSHFPVFYSRRVFLFMGYGPFFLQPIGCQSYLRRKDIAGLKLFYPAQSFLSRKFPFHMPVLQKHHMFTVVCNIFCMMLNNNNRFSLLLV